MNKVVNSVQQILEECNSMISQVEDCEFIDVKSLAETLKRECEELKKLYEENPDKERDIRIKKVQVEDIAIKLEFYMYVRLGLYADRYKMRNFASNLYDDTKDICFIVCKSKDENSEQILAWSRRTKWALSFFARSKHILFEVDEDDQKRIRDITENMKARVE